MAQQQNWTRPPAQRQFTMLGVQPWGGPKGRGTDPLPGKKPVPTDYPELLAKCTLLAETAVALREYAADGSGKVTQLEERHCSGLPVHPYALEDAIREYYTQNPSLSPLDVMAHCCRVVDRVLFLIGECDSRVSDSYRMRNADLIAEAPKILDRVRTAAIRR